MEASHVSALQSKHSNIERRIQQEMKSPLPDLAMIQALKRDKLRIRDEIAHH